MKKLIKQFNKRDTLIVISSYPQKNSEPAKQNAVACYAQNLLRAYKNRKIIVLSEKNADSKVYSERNILVIPTWTPASPLLYIELLVNILKFAKPTNILIQFEFNMLGSFVHSAFLPIFIAFLKLFGKSVTVMQHQVVDSLSDLAGHLNIKKNSLKNTVLTSGLHCFYFLTGIFSDHIIVHEDILKQRLSKWVQNKKINVISHGLYLEKAKNKSNAKEKLGFAKDEFVVLLFGYITWYKGTDWAINKIAKIAKQNPDFKLKLIVAGGESATLKSKSHYRKFVRKVKNMGEKNKDIVLLTGFVPDEKVSLYFSASDIVLLPYRAMMSASGPLSFALRFSKSFILSKVLSDAFDNPDAQEVLSVMDVSAKDLTFGLNDNSFENLLNRLISDKKFYNQVNELSANLGRFRIWNRVVNQYDSVIYKPSFRPVWSYVKDRFSNVLPIT
jgi:glycosyltransferase involved in cell wall biosynthesis